MGSQRRGRILLAGAVIAIALSVWLTSTQQRNAVAAAYRQSQSASAMLTAMLDQETGVRGYLLTGREEFLRPFEDGQRAYALAVARHHAKPGDRADQAAFDASVRISRRWLTLAKAAVADRRGGARTVSTAALTHRKRLMDDFRAANARLQSVLERRRGAQPTIRARPRCSSSSH